MRFNCVERPISRFFYNYGRYLAKNPLPFIIFPMLFTLAMAVDNGCPANKHVHVISDLYNHGFNITFPYFRFGTEGGYLGGALGGVKLMKTENGSTILASAQAWFLIYHLKFFPTETSYISGLWEHELGRHLADYPQDPYIKITYFHSQTLADELQRNADTLLPRFVVAFILLVVFSMVCSIALIDNTYYIDWTLSKPVLSIFGLINAGMGIITSLGMLMLFGMPFSDITTVMPFLVVAVGIDNMFLMVAAIRRTSRCLPVAERMAECMSDAAVAILITSTTGLLALFTKFEEDGRNSVCGWKTLQESEIKIASWSQRIFNLGSKPDPIKGNDVKEAAISGFFRDWYAPFLMNRVVRVLVFVCYYHDTLDMKIIDGAFYSMLRHWLASKHNNPWVEDLYWGEEEDGNATLKSFRFLLGMRDISSTTDQMDATFLFREVAARWPEYNITTFMPLWLFTDQYAIIIPNTVQNIIIALSCMVIIAFLLIPQPMCAFWVALACGSIDFGVVGYMTLWGVNLDAISMITIIMSIGFSVDYAAHITYGYVVSEALVPREKVRDALTALGWPLCQGALSTIIAVSVLANVPAYMIITFFKTVFLSISIGLLHGLVFLPVLLSTFVRGCCSMDTNHDAVDKVKVTPAFIKGSAALEAGGNWPPSVIHGMITPSLQIYDSPEIPGPTPPSAPPSTAERRSPVIVHNRSRLSMKSPEHLE
ncbi:Ptc [Trichostrongylus colubriformis]|uniref:Ptc n=1 Tax=Trichostrongylus colubriformis TaxID=6319 RepID=A0AAN8J1P4_TRICO